MFQPDSAPPPESTINYNIKVAQKGGGQGHFCPFLSNYFLSNLKIPCKFGQKWTFFDVLQCLDGKWSVIVEST